MFSLINPGPLVPAYEGVAPAIGVPVAIIALAILCAMLWLSVVGPMIAQKRQGGRIVLVTFVTACIATIIIILGPGASTSFNRFAAAEAYPGEVTAWLDEDYGIAVTDTEAAALIAGNHLDVEYNGAEISITLVEVDGQLAARPLAPVLEAN